MWSTLSVKYSHPVRVFISPIGMYLATLTLRRTVLRLIVRRVVHRWHGDRSVSYEP